MRIRITEQGTAEAVAKLENSSNKIARAIRSGIRRTLRGARKVAISAANERYVKTPGLAGSIKTSVNGFSGSMTSSGARNPLKKFNIRPRRRPRKMPPGGVFAQVVKGQGSNIRRAFVQRSGAVVERVGASRFPLRGFKSVSPPGMIGNPIIAPKIIANMKTRLEINLAHELAFFA